MGIFNRKVIQRYLHFQTTEYQQISRYFERMAAKGWMVTDYSNSAAQFKRIESRTLVFDVVAYKPLGRSESIDIKMQAEERGWTYVSTGKQFLVFYREMATELDPIYDDENQRYKAIKKLVCKTTIFLGLMILFFAAMGIWNLKAWNFNSYLSNSPIISIVLMNVILINLFIIVSTQILWVLINGVRLKRGQGLRHIRKPCFKVKKVALTILWIFAGFVFVVLIVESAGYGATAWSAIKGVLPGLIGASIGSAIGLFMREEETVFYQILTTVGVFAVILASVIIVSPLLNDGIVLETQEDTKAFVAEHLPLTLGESVDGMYVHKVNSSYYAPLNFVVYFAESNIEGHIDHLQYIEARDRQSAEFLLEKRLEEARDYIIELETIDASAYYLTPKRDYVLIQKDQIIMIVKIKGDFGDKEVRKSLIMKLFTSEGDPIWVE